MTMCWIHRRRRDPLRPLEKGDAGRILDLRPMVLRVSSLSQNLWPMIHVLSQTKFQVIYHHVLTNVYNLNTKDALFNAEALITLDILDPDKDPDVLLRIL